jgi:RNA polymerase-binding protein DksA
VKKPAAKAKSATKPAAKKAVAATAAKKVSATAHGPATKVKNSATKKIAAAPAKTASTAKKQATAARSAASSSKPVGRPAAVSIASPTPMKKPAAASSLAPATTPITSIPAAPAPAARGGRVSRLSQLTVPSMAQSVASTAAKSSFTQIVSTALVPPPPLAVKKDPKLANNWKTKSAEELTDQEVIAMPDSEYMNEKQMAFFRLKLIELKRGILENAGETTEHLREDTVVVPDPADRATIEEEHALELRTRDRERKLLKKIEQSIQRIDAGDYGYCDETGEPIGVGRLLARPTATLSLEAQQRRELKQKMFGD